MSPSFPTDATFQPGERAALEAALRGPSTEGESHPLRQAWRPASSSNGSAPRGTRLIKAHTCPITYPDGSDGFCCYDRQAPAIHRFRFTDAGKRTLATLWHSQNPPSSVEAIAGKATELVRAAFAEIVERERKEYFARASEGPGRSKHPERFQMSPARAKEVGGRYALCVPIGETGQRLLPVTGTFASLEAANQAWREKGDTHLVVACGNRLDRCWERPRRNALYKEFPGMAPRPSDAAPEEPAPTGG